MKVPKSKAYKILRSQLPQSPGVYILISSKKEILYIGATKNLRNRVPTQCFLNPELKGRVAQCKLIQTETPAKAFEFEHKLHKHEPLQLPFRGMTLR